MTITVSIRHSAADIQTGAEVDRWIGKDLVVARLKLSAQRDDKLLEGLDLVRVPVGEVKRSGTSSNASQTQHTEAKKRRRQVEETRITLTFPSFPPLVRPWTQGGG